MIGTMAFRCRSWIALTGTQCAARCVEREPFELEHSRVGCLHSGDSNMSFVVAIQEISRIFRTRRRLWTMMFRTIEVQFFRAEIHPHCCNQIRAAGRACATAGDTRGQLLELEVGRARRSFPSAFHAGLKESGDVHCPNGCQSPVSHWQRSARWPPSIASHLTETSMFFSEVSSEK